MYFTEPLFRPPAEAYSTIFQIMDGCPHNTCRFCGMYKTKKLKINSLESVVAQIQNHPYRISESRVFLADGDALFCGYDYLQKILLTLNESFPKLQKVSIYAGISSIQKFSVSQLKNLKSLKLNLFYSGLESGSEKLLEFTGKNHTPSEFIEEIQKVKSCGIKNSVTAILGLGGKKYSKEHAEETGKAVNLSEPNFFSLLTLIPGGNEEYIRDIQLLNNWEILQELKTILSIIETRTVFRSNHSSNLYMLAGRFPKDKERLIQEINTFLQLGKEHSFMKQIPQFAGEMSY